MDIENIRAFVAVAELKSISAAASQLNHLQSNMTAKIKKIEAHYRQELFIRNPWGMELTAEGRMLYRHYKKLLVLWEETEQAMRQEDPKLRLGTVQSVIGKEMTEALADLYVKYPELSVTLKTGTTEKIENELLQGNIDLAYTIGKSDRPHLAYRKIGTEELVLIGKKTGTGAGLEHCLQGETRLVLSEDCLYSGILEQFCSNLGIRQGPKTEIGAFEAMVRLASMGMGIALTSKRLAEQYGAADYMDLPEKHRYIDRYLVTRADYRLTPLEKQFIAASQML